MIEYVGMLNITPSNLTKVDIYDTNFVRKKGLILINDELISWNHIQDLLSGYQKQYCMTIQLGLIET